MKMQVLGVKRIFGQAKATGDDFDMAVVVCQVPVEVGAGKKVTVQGFGFETAELDLAPEALPAFAKVPFKLGVAVELDLQTEQRFHRGEFKTVCTGIAAPVALAAAR